MGKFDNHFLDDIRARVPISQVIGPRVSWDRKKTNASKGDYWAACPFHGEKSASFHCEDSKGRYFCFGCCMSGDHFKFLTELDGVTFPRAVELVADMAGMRMPDSKPLSAEEKAEYGRRQREREQRQAQFEADRQRDDERRAETAGDIWRATKPLPGTLGEIYFDWRCPGLMRHLDEHTVRFHPGIKHKDAPGLHPAVVGKVLSPAGKGTGVWRIYLAPDGRGKMKGVDAKVGLGPTAGGAVRLGGMAEHIGLAEGIETSAAVRELGETKPIWAGLSTSGIIGFVKPDEVKRITVYPDPDGLKIKTRYKHDGTSYIGQSPGLEAARKLVERYPNEASIAPAAFDDDYLAVLQRMKGVPIR